MTEPGFYSIIPVFLTLILSIWSRNVILGLFIGVFSGVLILNGPNPFTGMSLMIDKYLIAQASNSANVGILMLMIFISGLVGLMEKSGGAAAFAGLMIKFITSKAKAQLGAWASGTVMGGPMSMSGWAAGYGGANAPTSPAFAVQPGSFRSAAADGRAATPDGDAITWGICRRADRAFGAGGDRAFLPLCGN